MNGKMFVDRWLKDGTYVDEDGIHYDTPEEVLQCKIMGHCMCGYPEESLRFIRNALRAIDRIDWAERQEFFGPLDCGLEYTIYYMLDKYKLTEHGTSVPGWLTEKGEELLHDLDILLAEEQEDGTTNR